MYGDSNHSGDGRGRAGNVANGALHSSGGKDQWMGGCWNGSIDGGSDGYTESMVERVADRIDRIDRIDGWNQ